MLHDETTVFEWHNARQSVLLLWLSRAMRRCESADDCGPGVVAPPQRP